MEKNRKLPLGTDSLNEKEVKLFSKLLDLPREARQRIAETVLRYDEVEPEVNEIIEDIIKSSKNR
jgi:hypothetical protein